MSSTFTLPNYADPTIDVATLMIRQANLAARALWMAGSPDPVRQIELFGSIGRGEGDLESDTDLIVCVAEDDFRTWEACVNAQIGSTDLYGPGVAAVRLNVALDVLGISPTEVDANVELSMLDIFLFPENWRERLVELQGAGRYGAGFMRYVAEDAIVFDPETGFLLRELELVS